MVITPFSSRCRGSGPRSCRARRMQAARQTALPLVADVRPRPDRATVPLETGYSPRSASTNHKPVGAAGVVGSKGQKRPAIPGPPRSFKSGIWCGRRSSSAGDVRWPGRPSGLQCRVGHAVRQWPVPGRTTPHLHRPVPCRQGTVGMQPSFHPPSDAAPTIGCDREPTRGCIFGPMLTPPDPTCILGPTKNGL